MDGWDLHGGLVQRSEGAPLPLKLLPTALAPAWLQLTMCRLEAEVQMPPDDLFALLTSADGKVRVGGAQAWAGGGAARR